MRLRAGRAEGSPSAESPRASSGRRGSGVRACRKERDGVGWSRSRGRGVTRGVGFLLGEESSAGGGLEGVVVSEAANEEKVDLKLGRTFIFDK